MDKILKKEICSVECEIRRLLSFELDPSESPVLIKWKHLNTLQHGNLFKDVVIEEAFKRLGVTKGILVRSTDSGFYITPVKLPPVTPKHTLKLDDREYNEFLLACDNGKTIVKYFKSRLSAIKTFLDECEKAKGCGAKFDVMKRIFADIFFGRTEHLEHYTGFAMSVYKQLGKLDVQARRHKEYPENESTWTSMKKRWKSDLTDMMGLLVKKDLVKEEDASEFLHKFYNPVDLYGDITEEKTEEIILETSPR